MDQPTTSAITTEDQNIRPENIGTDTTKMIKRMIWKLKLEQQSANDVPLTDPVARTVRYTGMSRSKIDKLMAFGDFFDYNITHINRQVIHSELSGMIVRNQIPTITELLVAVGDKLPVYVNFEYFVKILIKMGYAFYKFPQQKSLRVMEKKSVTFERYKYLKSILHYRIHKVPIHYIGIFSVSSSKVFNLERTLQSDPKDLTMHVLFTVSEKAIENVKFATPSTYEELQKTIYDWFVELFVLNNMLPGSTCVLEDSKIFGEKLTEIPTWKSVKSDMVEWLEEHNVTCNINMPKGDLLQLIETCTDTKKNIYKYDNLITAQNYNVLRLPQCIKGLSMAASVISLIHDSNCFKMASSHFNSDATFGIVNDSDLKMFSTCLQVEEKKILHDDFQYENALDDAIRKAKTVRTDKCDDEDDTIIPVFSDSD